MKCPKCSLARPLADQVCRRCKYVFDEDRYLALTPPRATGGKGPDRFFTKRTHFYFGEWRSIPGLAPLASLIPGLGHVVQGRPWLGLLYCILVALFGAMSLTFFSQTYGRMFFGLAVSTHASCIMDTTPWARSPDLMPRMFAMGAILGGLLFLYWPLAVHLANRFVGSRRVEMDGSIYRPIQGVDQMVIMGILFVATIVVSAWLGRKLSSKES